LKEEFRELFLVFFFVGEGWVDKFFWLWFGEGNFFRIRCQVDVYGRGGVDSTVSGIRLKFI